MSKHSYDRQAIDLLLNTGLFDIEEGNDFIQCIKRLCPVFLHTQPWIEKYLKGIVRITLELADADKQNIIQTFIAKSDIFNEYLIYLIKNRPTAGLKADFEFNNKLSFADMADRLEQIKLELSIQSDKELSTITFNNQADYKLIYIKSYEQFNKLYGNYETGNGEQWFTAWCHVHHKPHFDAMMVNNSKMFILQKANYKDYIFNAKTNKACQGKDAYGMSLICIIIDNKNRLKYAILRGIHLGIDQFPDNQFFTFAELSKAVGFNVKLKIEKYINTSNYQCKFLNF